MPGPSFTASSPGADGGTDKYLAFTGTAAADALFFEISSVYAFSDWNTLTFKARRPSGTAGATVQVYSDSGPLGSPVTIASPGLSTSFQQYTVGFPALGLGPTDLAQARRVAFMLDGAGTLDLEGRRPER